MTLSGQDLLVRSRKLISWGKHQEEERGGLLNRQEVGTTTEVQVIGAQTTHMMSREQSK